MSPKASTSKKSRRAPRSTLSAQECAERAVAKYFDAILKSRSFFPLGASLDTAETQPSLGDAFEEVYNILEAEDIQQHGQIGDDDDLRRWDVALDAGYLVGVRVGLRLRGGAR